MRVSHSRRPFGKGILALALCGTAFSGVAFQRDAVAADSPQVQALLDQAKKDAGTEWTAAYDFLCKPDGGTANNANDPVIEPARIADNLYAIGRTSTTTYAVTTPEGIVMIDAGYANDVETVLVPGLKQLGLDPAQIKYVLITHGHADHYGGAAYLQTTYGARVVLSAEDWETAAAAGRPVEGRPVPVASPQKDVVAVPGQPIVVGGTEFTPVLIPGHTPGSLGFIFPVTDRGQRHVTGLFGGTILIHTRITDEGLRQYVESVRHFGEEAQKKGVDLEIQNHPMYDGMTDKLARLRNRQEGAANPFVVGTDAYQRFLKVTGGCLNAQLARRAANPK